VTVHLYEEQIAGRTYKIEVGIPGRRAICARHRVADTSETSILYVRPAICFS